MNVPQKAPTQSNDTAPGGECSLFRENLAAYVLKALDLFDRGLMEQHIRWCEDCRAEVGKLEAVVHRMGAASEDVGAPSSATWSAIRGRLIESDDTVMSAAPAATLSSKSVATKQRDWIRFVPAAIIAPLLVLVLVLGSWGASLKGDLEDRDAQLANRSLVESSLVGSGQVQLYSVQQSCPTCDGVGQVGVSESNGMGMVVGWDFDPEMQHDVWGVSDTGLRSAVCSLAIESDGAVMQMFRFPDAPSTFTDIYITDKLGKVVYVSHIVADEAEVVELTPST